MLVLLLLWARPRAQSPREIEELPFTTNSWSPAVNLGSCRAVEGATSRVTEKLGAGNVADLMRVVIELTERQHG
jgi:hypothetical protein